MQIDSLKLRIFVFVLHVLPLRQTTFVHSSDSKPLFVQGMQPMTGTGWTGGAGCLPAALMAVRHVNEKPGLLDDYNLTYVWADTQVLFAFLR